MRHAFTREGNARPCGFEKNLKINAAMLEKGPKPIFLNQQLQTSRRLALRRLADSFSGPPQR